MSQNKNITLSLKQKLQLVAEIDHVDKSELCAKYGCSRSTLNRIIKNKQNILEQSKTNPSSKRNRTGKSGEVDRAVAVWFHQMRASGATITSNMILDKALQFAHKMNKDYTPNSGWLWRWQKRQGISSLKKPPKESSGTENNGRGSIAEYSANDIFNADETSLLFKALQAKTGSRDKSASGQERLTLLLLCNATGDYKKVFVIGKPKIESFQSRNLAVAYYTHRKAWMTQEIWINILTSFDEELIKENRRVILFIDNAAPHTRLITLENIQLQYLPANAAGQEPLVQQPLAQGIIHEFKKYYRQSVILKTVAAIEEGKTTEEFERSFNVPMALRMIENAWCLVKPMNIANCFRKCNLVTDVQALLPDQEEDGVELNEVTVRHSGSLEAFEDYARCDNHIPCWGLLTEEEIIAEILPEGSSENDENDVVEVQLVEGDPLMEYECDDDDNSMLSKDAFECEGKEPAEAEISFKCVPQKNLTSLSLKQKLQIVGEMNRLDKAELCSKYGCSLSTLNRIAKNKLSILEKSQTINPCSKRYRSGKATELDRALTVWFNQMRATDNLLSTNILLEKAQEFALKMNKDYRPNLGWLWRWQKRQGISMKRLQGESKSSRKMQDHTQFARLLPTLIAEYGPDDIFNANETSLLFKALPTSTFNDCHTEKEKASSVKDSLTLLFVCNATGSYRRVFVVGKAKTKCFEKTNLPLKYYSQRKAWMTQEIWIRILIALDEEMMNQNRKIILFIANAPPHKCITLKNIQLQYLPANCSSSTRQPLEEGIVHSFKETYRQHIILKLIAAIEEGRTIEEFEKSINVLRALHMIKRAWWMVKSTCIANSFKKCLFVADCPNLVDEKHETNEIKEAVVKLVGCLENFQIYVRCDDNEPCYGLLTEEEIIAEVLPEASGQDEEFEECDDVEDFVSNSLHCEDSISSGPLVEFECMNYDENIPYTAELAETEMDVLDACEDEVKPHDNEASPSISEALKSLNCLQKYFLPRNKFGKELDHMEKYFLANCCPEIPEKSSIKIET